MSPEDLEATAEAMVRAYDREDQAECVFCDDPATRSCDGCYQKVCEAHGMPLRFAQTGPRGEDPVIHACPSCRETARELFILAGDTGLSVARTQQTEATETAEESGGLPKSN